MITREIDCRHLVDRVVDFILHAESRMIVLHGRPNSGKTELIRQWVLPALRQNDRVGEVWYGACGPGFPGVLEAESKPGSEPVWARFEALTQRKSILFIDDFGFIFDSKREDRRAVLDEMFAKLQDPAAQCSIVLVTDSKYLTSVYGLGVYDARIVDAVFDIGTISLGDGLQQLAAVHSAGAPQYHDDVLRELQSDTEALEHEGIGVTFDLLNILDSVFRANPQLAQHVEHYKNAGRLSGILRAHLDESLKRVAGEDDNVEAIARGILERVVDTHAQGIAWSIDDLLPRLAISRDGFNDLLHRLIDNNMLREVSAGTYLPVPLQLTTIIEQDLADQKQAQERIARMLDEALRSWSIIGNLLPRSRFAEIHRERRRLALSADHTRFMLHNALRYGDGELEGAAYYWLRRFPNRNEGADVLLASLFSDIAEVRMRAARLLRRYPEPEVRTRLHAVALTDPDARVRGQAVASLEPMKTDGLMNELLSQVNEEKSNYRGHAIETLKLFKDPRVTSTLAGIVRKHNSPPALRNNAIAVLGQMNTIESVDALLETALTDDEHDRQDAGGALGRTTSPTLIRHILRALETPTGTRRARIVSAVVTTALIILGASAQPLFWALIRAFPFVLVPAVAATVFFASKWLRGIRSGQIKRRSVRGVSGILLFMVSAATLGVVFHGLPQALIKQWKRAFTLFAFEILAFAFVFMFMSAVSLPRWLGMLGLIYFVGGVLLFAGTCITGIFAVMYGTIIHRDQLVLQYRRDEVYRRLLANADAARLVFNDLTSGDVVARKRARMLLHRFGDSIPGSVLTELLQDAPPVAQRVATRSLIRSKNDDTVTRLQLLWLDANKELRRRIAVVLCRHPNNSSVEALTAIRASAAPLQKARFTLAKLHYQTALWPRSTRVFLVIVAPMIAMVAYHGFNVVTNPAWGQIITLGTEFDGFAFDLFGSRSAVENNMVAAATVAAEHYPDKSADHLLRMFRERKHVHNPVVHGALARGLLIIDSTFAARSDPRRFQVRNELITQAGFFGGLIGSPEKEISTAAIDALQAMANSRDTVLSREGVRYLQGFVFNPGRVAPEDTARIRVAQANVISAIGGLRTSRAFPALRAILDTTGTVHGTNVRLHLTRVAERSYANFVERQTDLRSAQLSEQERQTQMESLERWAKRLLGYYEAMVPKPVRLIEDLTRFIQEAASCEQKADVICDAFAAIDEDPDGESGYRQILDHYAASGEYLKALDKIESVKIRHPTSVWPYKLIAEITHEHLQGTPEEFQRSFQEMAELRRLEAFSRLTQYDQRRFLADFAEIALSAGKHDELRDLAREVLTNYNDDGYRLNMALFLYADELMRRDRGRAEQRLNELERVVRNLPQPFYNNWIYPGTRKFFEKSTLPPDVKAVLLELCVEGSWYSQKDAEVVIGKNRKALGQL